MKRLTEIFDKEVSPIQERGIFIALILAIIGIAYRLIFGAII